jgi:ribonuclease P/MRP protein subunit RPP40
LSINIQPKDIGGTIKKNLKPTAQCVKTAGTTTAKLNQIRKNFHYRDRHFFLRLDKQYVRPHLEFAVPVWSSWLKGDIETLEKGAREGYQNGGRPTEQRL